MLFNCSRDLRTASENSERSNSQGFQIRSANGWYITSKKFKNMLNNFLNASLETF